MRTSRVSAAIGVATPVFRRSCAAPRRPVCVAEGIAYVGRGSTPECAYRARTYVYVWTNIACQVRDAAHAARSNSPAATERGASGRRQPSSTRAASSSFRRGSARRLTLPDNGLRASRSDFQKNVSQPFAGVAKRCYVIRLSKSIPSKFDDGST